MTSTNIPKQRLDTIVNWKTILAAYNTTTGARELREGLELFVRRNGYDALKTVMTAIASAIPAVNPTKLNSAGTVSMQTPKVGKNLVAVASHWDGIPKGTFTYQWKRDGTNISGATAATYVPISADVTHTLSCLITVTNTGGSGTETVTAANATVA